MMLPPKKKLAQNNPSSHPHPHESVSYHASFRAEPGEGGERLLCKGNRPYGGGPLRGQALPCILCFSSSLNLDNSI